MIYTAVYLLYCKVNQLYIHIYIYIYLHSFLDSFPIPIIRVLSKVPGAMYRSLLVIYFIYSSMSLFLIVVKKKNT